MLISMCTGVFSGWLVSWGGDALCWFGGWIIIKVWYVGDGSGALPWCKVFVCGRGLDATRQQAKQVADFDWTGGMIVCTCVGAGGRPRICCIGRFSRTVAAASALLGRTGRSYLLDLASTHMLLSKTKPCMCKYKLFSPVKLQMPH